MYFFKRRRIIRIKHRIHKQIDCHTWASKMEIQRLISAKSHIQAYPKTLPKFVE